ncbi:GntR family transcriptional regulator [Mycobacterium sp. CBMA293]|uniref:GntR family transcriptional regulator n=1 Tax=unclassified Mycolicibacterium TaxID=2636767 RepID=UPI0012DE9B0C|nr:MULTISPECIES: GntR family transcriptional regulator [unclassified Mycolicibacterium]MUL50016.1 GntR family transcriptional regulator [Mycolicibacterium sp. CBMA 360]MUL61928.1 GntR family transcriptional regulator [Mycolicibacterium sp. CBMA 335]MUL72587.1 GntR family transcriptional regulator [Mycolicibacterium sp. CBMA 311]MUL92782.1 GntR family transcriptional regulator [Mycolicibacterium sp. CBMA 230]MUM08776.1 GntR family transcriptional regulator [Mycolicibacterium sp. CBMA 213]
MTDRPPSPLLEKLMVVRHGGPQQTVVTELRRVILGGDAPPGTAVPLAEVAEFFGVSHIPVREALKTLISEGLVTHRPNSGYTVARMTKQELHEMYLVRATLEAAALSRAAERATDHERAIAVEANERMAQAIRDSDGGAFQRESRNFHMALVRPSGMHRLLHILEMSWNMMEPVQAMLHVTPDDRARINGDHDEMLEAFLARDIGRLSAVAQRHNDSVDAAIATLPTDTGLLHGE